MVLLLLSWAGWVWSVLRVGLLQKNVTVLLGRVFNKHISVLGTSDGVLWSQRVVSVPARWIRCKPECLSTCELGCLPVCRLIFGLSLFPLDLHNLELLSLPISDCVASSLNSCHIPPKVEFAALQWWVVISGFAQEGYHMETELNSGPWSSSLCTSGTLDYPRAGSFPEPGTAGTAVSITPSLALQMHIHDAPRIPPMYSVFVQLCCTVNQVPNTVKQHQPLPNLHLLLLLCLPLWSLPLASTVSEEGSLQRQ